MKSIINAATCSTAPTWRTIAIPYKTSIGHISASRGARGEVKKGKSSEFNQKNYEEVKSSPAVKVWLRDSVKVGVKFEKWVNFRVPKNVFFWMERVKIDFLTIPKS